MDKKGMQYWVIVGLILLLVVAVIFFIWLIYWKELATSAAGSDVCKISVLANVKTGGVIKQNCKTIETTIKEDDDERIKKQIANMMYTCWDQFGRGGLDVFVSARVPIPYIEISAPSLGKSKCFVCYNFQLKKDFIDINDMFRDPYEPGVWFRQNTYLKDKYYHDFFTQSGDYYIHERTLNKDLNYAIIFKEIEPYVEIAGGKDAHFVELMQFKDLKKNGCETYE